MTTQEIYNYIPVNEHLITGGQPTEAQNSVGSRGRFHIGH